MMILIVVLLVVIAFAIAPEVMWGLVKLTWYLFVIALVIGAFAYVTLVLS